MAGIFAIFKKEKLEREFDRLVEECATRLKHRGLKYTFKYKKSNLIIYFHQQKKIKPYGPLKFSVVKEKKKPDKIVLIDGQILNIDEINMKYVNSRHFRKGQYHLEGVIHGFIDKGVNVFNELFGSYSGVLFDGIHLQAFKDPIGTKPLYYINTEKLFAISSELKALAPFKQDVIPINPGEVVNSINERIRYYRFPKFKKYQGSLKIVYKHLAVKLNRLVKKAVKDSISKNENIASMLSGGLDSAIITHIAKEYVDSLKTYTVGLKNSKDINFARVFASKNNLSHDLITFDLNDMLKVLRDTIYTMETYDAALIRSAVPMYILAKNIKEDGEVDVLFTGEGADELFGGYEYLKNYTTTEKFNEEILNLLMIEHITGLQRVDRIPYSFSIEAKAPFFDKRIVEFSFQIPRRLKIYQKEKKFAKKWILRKAFEREIDELFIWRKKQKFSDGAGSRFILRDHFEKKITDDEFEKNKNIFPDITLRSKEELYYWWIFEDLFNPTLNTILNLGVTAEFHA